MNLWVNSTTELRLLHPDDAEEVFRLTDENRAHLRRWLPWLDTMKSPADTRAFIEMTLEQHAKGAALSTAIRHEGRIVGTLSYNNLNPTNRVGAIGYWLAESHNGRGIMTASVRALVDYGFTTLGLNRQVIACAAGNARSRAIPERLGFQHEGTARQAEWLYDHFVDHMIYAQLRSEAIVFEQATAADLVQITELTAACVAGMRAKGIEQWDDVYPAPADHTRDIERGTLHVLRENEKLLGCITMDDQLDPMWAALNWHPVTGPISAVHRVMVHPSQQGRGLAKRLMHQAEALARRNGSSTIRLDTFQQNPAALALYERLGYRPTGTAMMRKGAFVGFEKLL